MIIIANSSQPRSYGWLKHRKFCEISIFYPIFAIFTIIVLYWYLKRSIPGINFLDFPSLINMPLQGSQFRSCARHSHPVLQKPPKFTHVHKVQIFTGGMWFNCCTEANINGIYFQGGVDSANTSTSAYWVHWKGRHYSYKTMYIALTRQINVQLSEVKLILL